MSNSRLHAVAACLAVFLSSVAVDVCAAEPASGSLSLANPELSYSSGPFLIPNPGSMCGTPVTECDEFALTVDLPADYALTHPNDVIRISTAWVVQGQPSPEDIDLYLLDASGAELKNAATASNPEVLVVPAGGGVQQFTVRLIPYLVAGAMPVTTLTLESRDADDGATAAGLPPRFRAHVPPDGIAASAGEPSIGYNRTTLRAMFTAGYETDRVTFPEDMGLPEAADARWEDVSYPYNIISLDPIGFTDPWLGRSFTSQLTGANSIYGFTSDDGDSWTPGQIAPPNGGVDHQTTGSGPYPAGAPFDTLRQISEAVGFGNAVYYCSQSIAASFCARSDDGGQTFGPGIPTWTMLECGGLHGHVRVAYDGTVVVPNKGCGSGQGGAVSHDAGTTWTVFSVPGSSAGDTDPQMAWSDTPDPVTGNPVGYFCYVDGDGRARAAVTKDYGSTWSAPVNVGASVGVVTAVFAQAIAGDHDRASCAFIGTSTAGNYGALDFKGVWYPYLATTYDGGQSWQTVNATPTDPVQGHGGICTSGTTCGSNRNLLDFNEMSIDEEGRPLLGYADGCVGSCVQNPANNTFSARGSIIRQSGGRSLFKARDGSGQFSASAVVPAAPYLTVSIGAQHNELQWQAPDDGGAEITGYRIQRDGQTLATLTLPKQNYVDTTTAAGGSAAYTVAAINAIGMGADSNAASATASTGGDPLAQCTLPGVKVTQDATGDQTSGLPGHDAIAAYFAEPYFADNVDRFVITMQVDDLSLQPLPLETSYEVHFKLPGDAANIVDRNVSYDTTTGKFQYGHTESDAATGVNNSVNDGETDASSALDVANDRIVWVLTKDRIAGLQSAVALEGISAQVWQRAVALILRIDDSPAGGYAPSGNRACAPNTPPVAALLAMPQTGTAPLDVQFTGNATDADGDAISSYTLDFGDGSGPVTQTHGSYTHTYTQAGNYAARLRVSDARGAESSNVAEQVIQVGGGGSGGPLAVSLAAGYSKSPDASGSYPVSEADPLQVSFTASGSGGEGEDYRYTFYFGDGTSQGPQASAVASHAYAYASQSGYLARVVMTDSAATQAANSNEIVIRTHTGVTVIGTTQASLSVSPASGAAPLTVTADASGSTRASESAITEYRFDFGDGSSPVVGSSQQATHVYTVATQAVYTVTLTVTDRDGSGQVIGQSSASQNVVVNPGNQLTAILSVSPTSVRIGDTVTFDGCRSFAADGGSIARFEFDPGDGSATVMQNVGAGGYSCASGHSDASIYRHVYTRAGSFVPSLTVFDNAGGSAKVGSAAVSVQPSSTGGGGSDDAPASGTRSGGGAMGSGSLLLLLVAAWLRRQRVKRFG